MLYDIKEKIIAFFTSRLFLMYIILFIIAGTLLHRIFDLQIVHGQEYMDNFTLTLEKTVNLPATRGNIYDRNGVLLAYNDLAYMVTITDTIESGSKKNRTLNEIIYNLIHLLDEANEDLCVDFGIYIDNGGNYCFAYEGNQHLRFLADVYGKTNISDLLYTEKTANPDEVINYLSSSQKYGIGTYLDSEGKDTFMQGVGYTKEEILDIVKIRYNLGLNSYQKYISTTVATSVSDKTVAMIMENEDILQGVSIEETTVRHYNDSIYFSPIIGYTGKINQTEYENYILTNPDYTLNDMVGKTGIEFSMEAELQGTKGQETLYVDSLGRVIETTDVLNPIAGNDVYLTIDSNLQKAVYDLLEQKIAGILVNKIRNEKIIIQTGRNRLIPIYDVYYALINNNVINLNRLSQSYASETEKTVYNAFLTKQEQVCSELRDQLLTSDTPYKDLSEENQVYQSFIISMLSSSNYGIILTDKINPEDTTYLNWKVQETISIKEYLTYAISQQWIDISKLELDGQYSDSNEIYNALVDYIIDHLKTNTDFTKKLYKYMLLNDEISGKQLIIILWEQDIIQVPVSEIDKLKNGQYTAYSFMIDLISNIKITPAQLGLEPCSGSVVITNPNNGQVLALVSYPGYDNNRLSGTADSDYLARLNSDLSKPLWNYATQQRTAPGSTFKMLSSVAGYEEGVVNISTQITCTGVFDKLNGTIHKCWISPGSHGNMTMTSAIANSCNIYFYELGYRLANDGTGYNDTYGIQRLSTYTDMFGFNEKSGVEISESEPHVSDQYPVPSCIGQGTHSYTTVGIARYVTAVANKGTVYNLSLIDHIQNAGGGLTYVYEPNIRNTLELPAELWNSIHLGMRQVIESKKYYSDFGVQVAGKTGTAQEATNKPNHALFVGFAPYSSPEIAIAVRIANGYSSDFAAQLGKDVFSYYFKLKDENELITGTASEAEGVANGD